MLIDANQDTNVVMPDETSSVSVPAVSSAATSVASRPRPGSSGYTNISSSAVTSGTGASATPPVHDPGPGHALGGSNEDMKKVLMELDNTGYFAEVTVFLCHVFTCFYIR